jgi:hypothetical protein
MACRKIVPAEGLPIGVKLGELIRRLQETLPHPPNQPAIPVVPLIDWRVEVPVIAHQPQADAHDDRARTFFVNGMGDGRSVHVSAPSDWRCYVVRKGRGFTGIVQGSHIYTAMVADVASASGSRADTRDDAELAWRWAHAYQATGQL